jgi:uncharacterized protein (DUF2336 family)
VNAIASVPFPAPVADLGVVSRFVAWMRHQPAETRARAINLLARSYIGSALPSGARADALVAMTAALDDPAVSVRRALAEAVASAADAPRHLIAVLASDRAEVACPVLAHSPLIPDSLFAEVVRHGGLAQQMAIARRSRVGQRASWALADSGARAAVLALIDNTNAALDAAALNRILARFGADGVLREALLARGGLPAAFRLEIAILCAETLVEFGRTKAWLEAGRAERLMRDAREQAVVRIASDCPPEELPGLVELLRERSLLNVALLMRGLLSGDVSLFETALGVMSGAPARRVAGFIADWRGRGFAAVYGRSGLPEPFLPAFRAVLAALRDNGAAAGEGVSQTIAMRAIDACEALADPGLEPVLSLMWRLAGEGARDAAQAEIIFLAARTASASAEVVPLAVAFDPTSALAIELDIAVAELSETYGSSEAYDSSEAPRLDFAAQDFAAHDPADEDSSAPALPPALDFEGVNENYAPPIAVDPVFGDAVAA